MLANEKGRALASRMPRDRILTETDGPFAKVGERSALPWDVQRAVAGLAALWNEPEDIVEKQLLKNLRTLVIH
jgi:TatD DNase family protein